MRGVNPVFTLGCETGRMAHDMTYPRRTPWADSIFAAKAVAKGGVIRRAIRDVDRDIGRAAFDGLAKAVSDMRLLMQEARQGI